MNSKLPLLFLFFLPFSFGQSGTKSCLNDFQPLNDSKCTRFFNITTWGNVKTTHSFAVRQCENWSGITISIHNAIENNYILQMAIKSGLGGGNVWLGLSCFGNDPSKCIWDDQSGNANDWNRFAPGYPDVQYGECVQMITSGSRAGQWTSSECSNEAPYVCQSVPTLTDPSCDYVHNDFCYSISEEKDENLSIVNGELDCQSRGFHLVSIHSFAEFQFLRVGFYNMQTVIGARQIEDNKFEWLDGTPWDYSRITVPSNTPGDGCIFIRGWNQGDYDTFEPVSCSSKDYRYICKKPIGGPSVIPSPSNPPECNGTPVTLVSPTVFTSPNYPNVYSNGLQCNYIIRCPDGFIMALKFTDVHTEKNKDLITIRDGTDQNGELLGTLSGETRNVLFYSTSPSFYVTFSTDGQNVGFGFRAVVDTFTK